MNSDANVLVKGSETVNLQLPDALLVLFPVCGTYKEAHKDRKACSFPRSAGCRTYLAIPPTEIIQAGRQICLFGMEGVWQLR